MKIEKQNTYGWMALALVVLVGVCLAVWSSGTSGGNGHQASGSADVSSADPSSTSSTSPFGGSDTPTPAFTVNYVDSQGDAAQVQVLMGTPESPNAGGAMGTVEGCPGIDGRELVEPVQVIIKLTSGLAISPLSVSFRGSTTDYFVDVSGNPTCQGPLGDEAYTESLNPGQRNSQELWTGVFDQAATDPVFSSDSAVSSAF